MYSDLLMLVHSMTSSGACATRQQSKWVCAACQSYSQHLPALLLSFRTYKFIAEIRISGHKYLNLAGRESSHLLRLLAPLRPCRLAPLLTLLLALRLRLLRLTGEGLESEEVAALALGLPPFPESPESDRAGLALPLATSGLSSSLESETAGLAAGLELFFTSESLESEAAGLALALGLCLSLGLLSESLTGAGLLSLLGLPLLSERAGLLALEGGCLFSLGPASSESDDDKAFQSGLSALTYMQNHAELRVCETGRRGCGGEELISLQQNYSI